MIETLLIGGGIWLTTKVGEWALKKVLDETYNHYAANQRVTRAIDRIRGGDVSSTDIRIVLDAINTARRDDPQFRRAIQDVTTRELPEFAMDPFPVPPTLFGRDLPLGDLRTLLDCATPNVVQVVGRSGVGKTRLAAQAIIDLGCDYVRLELERTETPESIVVRLYELLHWKSAPERPHKDLISNILEAWKSRGCVLVLDNLHALMDDHANPKDDLARLLLDRLGGSGLKLLTLGWPSTTALGAATEQDRVFLVEGIDEDAGVQKLRAEGVVGNPTTISLEQVVRNLDGNPRMLEGVARLIRHHEKGVTILDENADWVADQAATLKAMWDTIGEQQQYLLVAMCVFRRERNSARLSRFFSWSASETREHINSLIWWRFIKSDDGQQDYAPDHDLIRSMVSDQVGKANIAACHNNAALMWTKEIIEANENNSIAWNQIVHSCIEAGFHLTKCNVERAVFELLHMTVRGERIPDLLDRGGYREDLLSLWRAALESDLEPDDRAVCLHQLGISYYQLGDWDKALAMLLSSIDLFKELGREEGIETAIYHIGLIREEKKEWGEAISCYRRSMRMAMARKDYRSISTHYHQIGILCHKRGKKQTALRFFLHAMRMKRRIKDSRIMASSYHMIGVAYQEQGKAESAIKAFNKAWEISIKHNDMIGMAFTAGQMGQLNMEQGNYKEAFELMYMAGVVMLSASDPQSRVSFNNLSNLRRIWGWSKFDKAWKERSGQNVPKAIAKRSEELGKGEGMKDE